jgi:iron complex outermembrane receptor protein
LKKLFASLILFAIAIALPAQVRVRGQLLDAQTEESIPYAAIEVHENGQRALTDISGYFELNLNPGFYHLHIEVPGFQAMDYDLRAHRDTTLIFKLNPTFLELQEVLVEESYSKTQQRKSSLNIEKVNLENGEGAVESSLAEVLKKSPGINAYNTGVGIAKPVIRGFTGTRVAVYDQGIKQEGQQWGMDHGLEIDPFNAGSVEIIKGPGALQYGSDAISGVMKVLPEPFPEEKWSGSFTGIYKSNNNSLSNSLQAGYRHKNQFVSGRISHQKYDDYRIPADEFVYNSFVLPVTDNTLKNTAGKLLSGRINYGLLRPGFNLRVMLSQYQQNVGLYPGATGIPRAYDVGDIGDVSDIDFPNQEITHTKAYAKLNFKLGNNWLVTDFGFQQNVRHENSRPHAHGYQELDPNNTLALGLDLKTYTLNTKYSWRTQKLKYIVGTNHQHQQNRRSGWEYLLPDFDRYNGGVFGLIEGEVNRKLNWNAGVRGDFATLSSDQHLQQWFFNPDSLVERSPALQRNFYNYAFALGFAYNPNEWWNLKLNLARSFRVPVPAELVSNGIHHGTFRHEVGTPDLDSEVGYQADLGISYTQKVLYLKLTPFFNYFQNYLFLRPSARFSPLPDAGQLYNYTQAEAIHSGAELFLEYHPIKPLHISTALEYVYSYNIETGLPLPFTPPLSNLLTTEYEWKRSKKYRWSIGGEYRWTAAQNRTDRNEKATPGYHLFNAKMGYTTNLGKVKMGLGLRVQNIFNTSYLQHLSRYRILNLPEQGRNVILSVSLSF